MDQADVSRCSLLLVNSSFAEGNKHVLTVRAGDKAGSRALHRKSSKGRWHSTELLETSTEIPLTGSRWPHSGNQTKNRSKTRSSHSLWHILFEDSRLKPFTLTSEVNMFFLHACSSKTKPVYKMSVFIFHERCISQVVN